MSRFATDFVLTAWETLADLHGVSSSTYTPPSGAAITALTVILNVTGGELDDGEDLETEAIAGVVTVKVSDVTTVVTEGRFTIDSVAWTVVGTPHSEGGLWECPVKQAGSTRQRIERNG